MFYSSEKRFKIDNDDMVMTIESRLKLMTQKISQLVNSWNEQTRGLHLDSDGQLCGLYDSNTYLRSNLALVAHLHCTRVYLRQGWA